MYSVTSGAVYSAVNGLIKTKDIIVVFSSLSWVPYASGGYYSNSPIGNYLSNYNKILGIMTTKWIGLDCRGFYVGLDSDGGNLSFVVETSGQNAQVWLRIVYI